MPRSQLTCRAKAFAIEDSRRACSKIARAASRKERLGSGGIQCQGNKKRKVEWGAPIRRRENGRCFEIGADFCIRARFEIVPFPFAIFKDLVPVSRCRHTKSL